ncbi:MAG: hypothetical protein HY826_11875 [Actinobacteria bacterium]|nr:hypothetical protein [Actinomycetota bacterium]
MSSLRNWAKDRLGEQEDLLRSVERAIARLAELDDERSQVVETVGACVVRLGELGLDEHQVAAFVGVELGALRAGRSKPSSPGPSRRASAAPVNGEVLS